MDSFNSTTTTSIDFHDYSDGSVPDSELPPELRSYSVLTSAELDSGCFELEYLIEKTLVAGQPCIVAGAKKVLKTSVIIDLGIACSVGGYFLGKMKCTRPARVLVMSGESGLGTIQETARRIAAKAGHQLRDLDNLLWSTDLPQFGHLDYMDALKALIEEHGIQVLVIDPAYLCMPSADAANLMAQGVLLRGMNRICNEAGATMILAHHTRKRPASFNGDLWQPPELEDIAWAGFQEWARQWLLIGRRERYEPGSNMHRLWINVGGSAGHSALWAADIDENGPDESTRGWSVGIKSGSEARHEAVEETEREKRRKEEKKEGDDKRRLWVKMLRYPKGDTIRGYREKAGLSGTRAARAMELLSMEGRIEECKVKKGRGHHDGYRPKEDMVGQVGQGGTEVGPSH